MKNALTSYRDLVVWQKSYALTLEIYKLTKAFPKEELYGLVSQVRRSSSSIPSNIAEGYSFQSSRSYLKFLRIAFASGAELETQLQLSKDLGYVSEKNYLDSFGLLQEVMKMLNVLIRKVKTSA